jgi:DNA-binding NarL/FixJ family response regulator
VAEKLAGELDFNSGKALHENLSNREFEVFRQLALGKSVTDISALFSLSPTTVSTYKARIFLKMNLHNNADLIMYAMQNSLI